MPHQEKTFQKPFWIFFKHLALVHQELKGWVTVRNYYIPSPSIRFRKWMWKCLGPVTSNCGS